MKITMHCKILLIFGLQFVSAASFSAILIEQGGRSITNIESSSSDQTENKTSIKRAPSWENRDDDLSYENFAVLRKSRRVSVSAQGGGNSGTLGALLELAFTPDDSALILTGLGNGFKSLGFQWKHIIDNELIVVPYFATGLILWQNAGSMRSTNEYQGKIISNFLNSNDTSKVEFGLNFINASVGIQYTHLNGEYVGLTYFGEFSYLFHPETGKSAPLAGFGAGFYF